MLCGYVSRFILSVKQERQYQKGIGFYSFEHYVNKFRLGRPFGSKDYIKEMKIAN